MLSSNQVLEAVKSGRKSECIDHRDYSRLCDFFPPEQWHLLGFKPNGEEIPPVVPLTIQNVIDQLRGDVAFGFEKALDKRGISSSLMYETVKMWMWVLEDPLQDFDSYAMYGLPLFKAVAVKYGFPNPIGDDEGSEEEYNG